MCTFLNLYFLKIMVFENELKLNSHAVETVHDLIENTRQLMRVQELCHVWHVVNHVRLMFNFWIAVRS